ncbi:MAG: hypothetical protein H6Q84_1366 [Deltaproteobacteria bacterium]|nr:hypothetical protein [Deltaproteobacteria bacterium]
MEDPRAAEGVRFAALAASEPSLAVRRWKVLSGRKAVGCSPRFPVPEILHCVGLLPVLARDGEEILRLEPLVDAWAFEAGQDGGVAATGEEKPVFLLEDPVPATLADALDRVEALAEWAEKLSGEPCSEGALEKSLRAYEERDVLIRRLAERCGTSPGFLDPGVHRALVSSACFLPAETHAILLGRVLGADVPEGPTGEEAGDPFLRLAHRWNERRRNP